MSMLSVKVNSKNQITIPKSVREKLHIKAGDQFLVDVQKNMMILLPKPTNYTKYLQSLYPEIWKSADVHKYLNDERVSW